MSQMMKICFHLILRTSWNPMVIGTTQFTPRTFWNCPRPTPLLAPFSVTISFVSHFFFITYYFSGHYAKKRRRSLHSRDEELFSDPDHIEVRESSAFSHHNLMADQETTEDGHTPRSTRSRQRSQYLDPLDIAEGRGQRYRNLSEGPSLDPAVYAAVRKVVGEIKLESSKSPILDALVYCALKGWGMRLTKNEGDDIRITVDDFQEYYRCSAVICSKEHPTEDQSARIKALRRWFPDFPAKQDEAIMLNQPFEVQVMRTASKDNKPRKLREIISRMTAVVAAEKRNNKRPREE